MILLSSVLFALAHPNEIFHNGIPALGWVMYLPALFVIRRSSPVVSVFWGALYGFSAFGLFNYWLSVYHAAAGTFLSLLYFTYFAILFFVLRLAAALFPRNGFFLQWCVYVAFEYLRTLGFLGYAYGISAYTQWSVIPLIQIASVAGIWAVSALVLFPQIYIAFHLNSARWFRETKTRLCALCFLLALAAFLAYGFTAAHDFSEYPSADIALVQSNSDPWKDERSEYEQNLRVLKRLSEEALAEKPNTDLVVWSETAFVPMIYWHLHYRTDRDYTVLVKDLLDWTGEHDVPFMIGNDDGRRIDNGNGFYERIDYNAAMLIERGEIVEIYRKMHLVPFTEHFPYQKEFPFLYKILEEMDPHYWETGTKAVVFDVNSLRFSTPICFEDTFSDISRGFVQKGAGLIVNLSNDSWSHSLSCQMQHLSMAVFRAVENRRAMVRSTASGQTCGIAPDGKILAMAPPFAEAFLNVNVPIVDTETFYTKHGDFLPPIFIAAAIVLFLAGIARRFRIQKG